MPEDLPSPVGGSRARPRLDPQKLLRVDRGAPLIVLRDNERAASEQAWGWGEAGLFTRRVRGHKARTTNALFGEMSAALQFPYYFGENWDAFDECLSDLEVPESTFGVAVLVTSAEQLLGDESDDELKTFVALVERAAQTYARPSGIGEWWHRGPHSFHVVLQVSQEQELAFRTRWLACGATLGSAGDRAIDSEA